jgi:hypothetical protein
MVNDLLHNGLICVPRYDLHWVVSWSQILQATPSDPENPFGLRLSGINSEKCTLVERVRKPLLVRLRLIYNSFIIRISLSFWLTVRRKKRDRKALPLTLSAYLGGTMRNVFLRPRDKKMAQNTAKTALLATAALAIMKPYPVTPSPLTVVCTAATAMVQNRAFHDFRAVGVPLAQVISSDIPG